ncbi:MAG: DUF4962 domain-containing protein, partial [Pseudobdellovibrionaceae bacterium]|nr:DUF4962 domain-containing protein [Pseudobdellovibrionaceae bacterium]
MKILLSVSLLSLLLSCSNDFQESMRHRTDSENSLPEQNSRPESQSGADITDPELLSSNDPLALRHVTNPQNRGTGRVLMEQWDGIPGKSIDALKSFKDFPSRPSSRVFLDKLETPKNSADSYGRRIRGYLHVTQPGDYVFYIAGDDESQFFLSTTDKPGDLSRQPIAAISDTEWTALTEWEKYPGQTSAPVHLEAGQRYYFEVLNKEAAGKDGVAVGWKLPDGEVQRPIPGRSLSSFEVDHSYTTSTPPAADLLKTLSRQHPRLLGSALDFARLKENLATQPNFQKIFADIKGVPGRNLPPPINPAARRKCNKESADYKSAEQLLSLPTCTRIMEGIRLLDTSREVLSRVQTLAMSYKLTGEKKFADRAIQEMRAVADPAWGDWNPKHFLDTAEMTHALAVGYDWLYDVMSDADRKLVRAAIKTKGLEPSFSEYSSKTFWTSTKGNWNIVCNSGLTLGALTIAEHEPEIATRVIDLALKSTKDSQSVLAWGPDGAHPEGIAYWGYALRYLAAFISGLEYSLGRDVGLGKVDGLSKAGEFPLATFLSGDRY